MNSKAEAVLLLQQAHRAQTDLKPPIVRVQFKHSSWMNALSYEGVVVHMDETLPGKVTIQLDKWSSVTISLADIELAEVVLPPDSDYCSNGVYFAFV